jgi:hypothetical protein
MNDKTFLGFLLNRTNLWGGLIFGAGIPLFNYMKSNDFYQSLSISLGVVLFLLLLSLHTMFKKSQKIEKLKEEKENELDELKQRFLALQSNLDNKTKQYDSNIKELNMNKGVVSAVKIMLASEAPTSKEAKQLMIMLKNAVKISFKG